MSDDRDAVYLEGDRVVYRASSVGMCDEALLALRNGATAMMPPEWLLEKYDEGTEWEERIVAGGLEQFGGELVSSQDTIELEITPNLIIRGHTDGRASGTDDPTLILGDDDGWMEFGVEAKKLGPDLFKSWSRGIDSFFNTSPYYRDQLTIYMHATGLPFLYVVGEWDRDAKECVAYQSRFITEPPSDINDIKAKVLRIEARAMKGEPGGECGGGVSWPCPVYYMHEDERGDGGEDEDLLRRLAGNYLNYQRTESAAKKNKDAVMKEISALMVKQPDKVKVDGALLTKYDRTSRRLDKDAAKQDGIDLSKYETETKKQYVKVTATDGGDGDE